MLLASIVFYMAGIPEYILILILVIIIDYYAGILIENASGRKRKGYLAASIVANLAILFFFKYFNFVNDNIRLAYTWLGWEWPVSTLSLLLPIGLSFHTFQSMSYTIEVYRGHQRAERHFGIYALYVLFYPQLVAGPIERPQNLLEQFRKHIQFDYDRITDGLKLVLWGLFKKVVIADRLAALVDVVYNNPRGAEPLEMVIATIFFAFQIYCDFSGYSDMAIGIAQVYGIKLMDNFNRPYSAKSIDEFWKRWHISLSTWFKDYLYIPLGGNRVPIPRWYFNLFITFLISGLWHGASWTFVVWGSINGIYLIIGASTKPFRKRIAQALGIEHAWLYRTVLKTVVTFTLICIAWVFFRSASIEDAWFILQHGIFNITAWGNSAHFAGMMKGTDVFMGASRFDFIVAIGVILLMEIIHMIQHHNGIRHMLSSKPTAVRYAIYVLILLSIFLLGKFENQQFIYFQF